MKNSSSLNKIQCGFLKGVPKYERAAMRQRLLAGGEVVVFRQTELTDTPAWAVAVKDSEYWITCEKTPEIATEKATRLGFQVVTIDKASLVEGQK